MKIKDEYILRQVAGTYVVLPIGYATLSFNGMLTLNDTAVHLWKLLENGASYTELVDNLTQEYAVSLCDAQKDVEEFIESLNKIGCLEF